MDAVLLALLILLPFIAVYLLQWWWIRRSPNNQIASRRRQRTYVILFVIAIVAASRLFTRESKLRRVVTGESQIKIINKSGKSINDLEYVINQDGGESFTNLNEALSVNSSESFATKGPLVVKNLRGRVGTNQFSFTGTVNKGQRLSIRIAESAQITPVLD